MPRFTRLALAATIAAAIAPPAAQARLFDPTFPQPPTHSLRSLDAGDPATPSPHLMVVPHATPAAVADRSGGVDAVAVGAGVAGLALAGVATVAVSHRPRRRTLA